MSDALSNFNSIYWLIEECPLIFLPRHLPASPPIYVPAHLVFAQQPANSTVNKTIKPAVVVDVEDGNGNIRTSDNALVSIVVARRPGPVRQEIGRHRQRRPRRRHIQRSAAHPDGSLHSASEHVEVRRRGLTTVHHQTGRSNTGDSGRAKESVGLTRRTPIRVRRDAKAQRAQR